MNDLLESYLSAVLRENEKINLTNIRDHSVARILHLEDSLAALDELNQIGRASGRERVSASV